MHLSGITVPLVTPLSGRDTLDHDALERLLEHIIAGGVSAVFILGTTGEGPNLDYRLRGELVRATTGIVTNRIPVLVSVTDTAYVESIHLGRLAADAGASALVFAAPYYFPFTQEELATYSHRLIRELPLPVMVYNMPSMSKVGFSMETLRALQEEPNLAGVKDSGGDLDYYSGVCSLAKARPDWTVLIGPEAFLIQSVQLGGHGGVNGGANLFPKLFVDAYNQAVKGNDKACDALQQQIESLGRMYAAGYGSSKYISTTKYALSRLGLCDGTLTEPFDCLPVEARRHVDNVLESFSSNPS